MKPCPPSTAASFTDSLAVDALQLLPAVHWDRAFYDHWQPGEDGAWQALQDFIDHKLPDYPGRRDYPAVSVSSRLSAHLHFGEISALQAWNTLSNRAATSSAQGTIAATESWLRELAWREFSHHLLYHFPTTPLEPLDSRFGGFPWKPHYQKDLQRWQRGQTGIPLVDAGMRELWATGYMHNRVRMIVASFLVKNLLIPWQEGARWFWNTLVDADLANNTMGWQWCAGCGADAAPYFRIFNPVLQGETIRQAGQLYSPLDTRTGPARQPIYPQALGGRPGRPGRRRHCSRQGVSGTPGGSAGQPPPGTERLGPRQAATKKLTQAGWRVTGSNSSR